MVSLLNVQALEVIAECQSVAFYSGYSSIHNQKVLIKILKAKKNSLNGEIGHQHEVNILNELGMEEVLQPLGIEGRGVRTFYKYTSSLPLWKIFDSDQSINDFLDFAIKLTSIMGEIHQRHYLHCNLSPTTIFVDPKTKDIKLTGFHHSRKEPSEKTHHYHFNNDLELPYIAPEQTGRMNRFIDYRTDLYSIGVIFYEYLTKRTPFLAHTPIEWFQKHLTKQPIHPCELNQNIPVALAEMILKLLNKSPEERYQSVFSLKEDLIRLRQLFDKDMVHLFSTSHHDHLSLLSLDRIYGRQEELHQLKTVCSNVEKGESQLFLLFGDSGTGKTALVEELKNDLKNKPIYFIQGKFDLLIKNTPYSGILTAVKLLLKKILVENNSKKYWAETLQHDLSAYLPMLSNYLPELKWLVDISDQQVKGIDSADTKSHFYFMFQKLIRIFAKKEHPLILFLDDIQWADPASLNLIEYLLSNKETEYFLVIGAYRENEVDIDHHLHLLERNLIRKTPINKLRLNGLTEDDLKVWLNTFSIKDKKDLAYLSNNILRLSQGNPFHIKQLIHSFITSEVIVFDELKKVCKVDKTKLMFSQMEENIVTHIEHRFHTLPNKTKLLLKIASCIGSIFDLQTLSNNAEQNSTTTKSILQKAIDDGLVSQLSSSKKFKNTNEDVKYKFVHDQIQGTIYASIDFNEKKLIHSRIGKYLLASDRQNDEAQLLIILYHLNYSREDITEKEKIKLVKLNIQAGKYSKKSAAFQSALSYFLIAHEILGTQWELFYDLTFDLLIQLGEAYYLNSQFEQSEFTFDLVLSNAKSKVEKLAIYNLKITLYTHVHRVKEAVVSGVTALRLFDEKFPSKPTKLDVLVELLLLKLAFIGKKPEDILNLPLIKSEEKTLILKTLINLNGPSYHVDQNLSTIFMLRAMRMTLKYGLTEFSPLVLNNYALILSAGFSDFTQSYDFGKLALLYANKNERIDVQGRVYFVFGSFVNHWKKHIKENITLLEKSQKYCVQSGNLHLAGANSSFIVISHLLNGTNLNELGKVTKKQQSFIKEIKYVISEGFLAEVLEWTNHLIGVRNHNWHFKKIIDDDSAKIIHYTIRLTMAYLFNKADFASEVLQELSTLVTKRLTLVIAPEFYFYQALVLIRKYKSVKNIKTKNELYKNIVKSYQILEKYAEQSPVNYKGKQLLIRAELAVISDKKKHAIKYFDEAILSCETSSFVHMTAICYESAGLFYMKENRQKQASFYLTEAYHHFMKWGAIKKAEDMVVRFEHSIVTSPLSHQGESNSLQNFELNAVYQAAQILSREVQIEQLLEKLISITISNTGATKGTILLKQVEDLTVVAQSNQERQQEDNSGYSKSVVQYVLKTGEIVQLDYASQHAIFQEDEYIKNSKAKSIICLPIMYQQDLKGILYLENERVSHVFTEERLKFLKLLSTQAAILIDNATLYRELENKVQKRTVDLEYAKNQLIKAHEQVASADERRRQLLSNISHDLKSPIASVQGYMEAILEGFAETEEQRNDYIRNSIVRIKSLNILINDLFDLTQLEFGHLSFSFDYVRIDRLLKHIKESFEYDVSKKGLHLHLKLPQVENGLEYPLIEVDFERIKQVFTNLLTNAIKHTEEGGIELKLVLEQDHIIIACSDTGLGIDKDDLPYVFERNFTVSTRPSMKGHGLGLSICKEIIKSHNGFIWAESELEKGTTIFIRMPIVEINQE
ncbi:AAA family ATPase [Metabacillus litoralis]|uniref:AAA family ATPase n=1 Tax=Metabacillus litoralis TaxID=152268 RepID=UPI001CFDFC80|nr:AAA family ATPase [Metabacillus litoralis]